LEIVGPDHSHPQGNRLEKFLNEFGSSVHHVTLLVQSVAETTELLEILGISTVGKSLSDERYQEAFILPANTGGILVQLSWKDVDDEGWARRHGHKSVPPRTNAANFYGMQSSVKDLDSALDVWRTLGGRLRKNDDFVDVYWDESPLIIRLNEGETREGIQLLFGGCKTFEGHKELGPAIHCPKDLGATL
jgi:catechol 2,3-dioxygenase-like lactoylglutathione lyase family enzyme